MMLVFVFQILQLFSNKSLKICLFFYKMHQSETISITEVTQKNFENLWPKIIKDVFSSSFISIDAEMSGLGSTKNTMTSNLNERYAAILGNACTRSIVSLGLACFSTAESSTNGLSSGKISAIKFNVSVYNIILLCSDSYVVDPSALEFLVNHGFDFNKQYAEGIPYYKGNDSSNETFTQVSMRKLLCEIIRQRKPLVLHNGLTDLIFLYQCFYANCPQKLTALMADVHEIFPSGVYDTKYTAEFFDHTPASFLLYLFRYSLLKNKDLQEQEKLSLDITFNEGNVNSLFSSFYKTTDPVSSSADICIKYAAYGWCVRGSKCKKSHDIDAIIKMHGSKTSKKRKRKEKSFKPVVEKVSVLSVRNITGSLIQPQFDQANEISSTSDSDANVDEFNSKSEEDNFEPIPSSVTAKTDEIKSTKNVPSKQNNKATFCKGHRSGVDAFMTGYVFALFFVSKIKPNEVSVDDEAGSKQFSDSIPYFSEKLRKSVVNKLYLSGKSIPLSVCKSSYTKTSKNHNEKILKVYLK